ncbi:MAG TPA: ABC transporter ATP-binding protein [Gemmatales bacterium]|nr:ABC transporter ATP-binding protein [Gemmatales bacterium]
MPSSLAIDAQAVSARHGDGTEAFHTVTLQLQNSECVGLVGPNGAGKTSFLLTCTGILPFHAGQLSVFGLNPMDRATRYELPRKVGLVMQQSDDQLFNPTVLDDVAFGPLNLGLSKDEVRQRVALALAQVKLVGYEDRVPHRLSGGEKRRVALAGILAMQPQLLLLDEPTQDLDPRGRRELMEIVQQLPQAKLIASHDLDFILECCPRTVVFDRTVVADGPTRELLVNAAMMDAHGLR